MPSAVPILLWLDTTDRYCRVGLLSRHAVIAQWQAEAPNQHMEQLAPHIQQLLESHGAPACIAVNRGPGSFTGIRIGMAAAQGLAEALDIPLIGFSTFDLLDQVPPPAGRRLQIVHPGRLRAYARGLDAAGKEWLTAGAYALADLQPHLTEVPVVSLSPPPPAWPPAEWRTVDAVDLYAPLLQHRIDVPPPSSGVKPLYLAQFVPTQPKHRP